jgi:hypothetical protein
MNIDLAVTAYSLTPFRDFRVAFTYACALANLDGDVAVVRPSIVYQETLKLVMRLQVLRRASPSQYDIRQCGSHTCRRIIVYLDCTLRIRLVIEGIAKSVTQRSAEDNAGWIETMLGLQWIEMP